MKQELSFYTAMEKILHLKRLLNEKLGRIPTVEEIAEECELAPAQINKILTAADGFGFS